MMRWIVYCFVLTLPSMVKAQVLPPDSVEMDSILRLVAEVDTQLSSFDTILKHDNDQSTDGGTVTGYYKNGALKKITARYFGETGKIAYEFYPKKEEPAYTKVTAVYYNRPYYWDEETAKENDDDEIYNPEKSKIEVLEYIYKQGGAYLISGSRVKDSPEYDGDLASKSLHNQYLNYIELLNKP